MNLPEHLKYTASHEWVRVEDDGSIAVGITDHAQAQLGDLVYVELPAKGRKFAPGETCAVVESVKAASDIYAPVGGEIVAVNDALSSTPESVNEDAYAAWLFKLKPDDPATVDRLLNADGYRALVGE